MYTLNGMPSLFAKSTLFSNEISIEFEILVQLTLELGAPFIIIIIILVTMHINEYNKK